MTSRRRLTAAIAASAMGLGLVPLAAPPAAAATPPEVVAEGLNSPYKLTFDAEGVLHVAEAGAGGDQNCLERQSPESDEVFEYCYGETGAVAAVDVATGDVERVVEGLPSISSGEDIVGPADVAFSAEGEMHVITGLGGDLEFRDHFADDRIGSVLRIDEMGEAAVLSDLVQFEADNDPDAAYDEGAPEGAPPISEGVDSNPFGLTFSGDDVLAVDAGGNTVLRVTPDGTTTVEALLPFGMTEAPPFLGLPPGTEIPYQPVPTGIDLDAEGTPLVGQLTGFPFPVGGANVYDVSGEEPAVAAEGFTNIMDIDVAPDGSVYVLEFNDNGLLAEDFRPALIQIRPDGTRKYILYGELPPLGGVEVGPDGMVYVTACTLCGPGAGQVWRIDPSLAADPATGAACLPDEIPGSGFPDIKASTHYEAIECAAHWGAIAGFADGTFGPQLPINRAQAASMMARALETAGVELPADPPDAFTDDEGTHEDNIDALAALGIVAGYPDGTYHPSEQVTRAQIASMFARAWETMSGGSLDVGPDAFTDDEGSVHEDNINAVANAGWVVGVGEQSFAPDAPMVRGQFASVLMRMLSTLVDEGLATPPAAG